MSDPTPPPELENLKRILSEEDSKAATDGRQENTLPPASPQGELPPAQEPSPGPKFSEEARKKLEEIIQANKPKAP